MEDGFELEIKNRKNLVVLFGGVNMRIGLPVFEFRGIMSRYDFDKVFIRDLNQAWYHKGVDSQINSLSALIEQLEGLIKEGNYDKVIFIGNSMGGYAAIMLGYLMKINHVIAFSPQTFIAPLKRVLHLDFRWPILLGRLHIRSFFNQKYDLLNVLRNHVPTTFIVYYSKQHRLDRLHSVRLKKSKCDMELHAIDSKGHGLVRVMRDIGELKLVLDKYLLINEKP